MIFYVDDECCVELNEAETDVFFWPFDMYASALSAMEYREKKRFIKPEAKEWLDNCIGEGTYYHESNGSKQRTIIFDSKSELAAFKLFYSDGCF